MTSPIITDPDGTAEPLRSVTADEVMGGRQRSGSLVDRAYGLLRSIPVWVLWLLVVIWSIPTLG
ncbi:MAG TPA: hypothetical protein VGK49_09005, partial [Ilumatobacteraceae bacterium]